MNLQFPIPTPKSIQYLLERTVALFVRSSHGFRASVGAGSYLQYLGDCQNYGPFLGPYYNTGPNTGPNLGDPKRDHNFDNPPFDLTWTLASMSPAAVSRDSFFAAGGICLQLWVGGVRRFYSSLLVTVAG